MKAIHMAVFLLFFATPVLHALSCPKPSILFPENQRQIQIASEKLTLITHSSTYFDPLRLTENSMRNLVSYSKQNADPVYYLHDEGNPNNPYYLYMYDDCEPDGYLYSEIGFYSIDISQVRDVTVAGGYYELCENNTVRETVHKWASLKGTGNDFSITQVTDAIFAVGEDVEWTDPYYRKYQDQFQSLRARHPKSSISLSTLLDLIGEPSLVVDYLKRRLPSVPSGWNVMIEYLGKTTPIQQGEFGNSTLTFRFVETGDLSR